MIDIRRCKKTEIQDVMSFIDSHWNKGHVLATSKDLMDWQHGSDDESYDYLVAKDGDKLLGVLGYISTRRFDPSLPGQNVIWLALWKVVEGAGVAGLGLRMLDALKKLEPHVAIAVNGINFNHPPMYKALRYEVGELRQYFVTCPGSRVTLASAPDGYSWPTPSGMGAPWEEMTADALRSMDPSTVSSHVIAHKTPSYFASRFFGHPVYRYRVFLLTGEPGEKALIATRLAEHQGARALRLVDFAGAPSALKLAGDGLTILMKESLAEYADFWSYGMDEGAIRATGMIPVDPLGPVVVPNYFEPFLARNGRILCAIKQMSEAPQPVMIFRADGDQDRPNLMTRGD
jgi:hypothetical protein